MQLNMTEDSNPEQSRLETSMRKIEQSDAIFELDNMKRSIKQSMDLDSADKHNLIVDINIAQWQKTGSKRFYSIVVLILLTLS